MRSNQSRRFNDSSSFAAERDFSVCKEPSIPARAGPWNGQDCCQCSKPHARAFDPVHLFILELQTAGHLVQ
jgi:hypothetical protein